MRSTEASGKSASLSRLSPQKMTRVSRREEREGRFRISDCGLRIEPVFVRWRELRRGRRRTAAVDTARLDEDFGLRLGGTNFTLTSAFVLELRDYGGQAYPLPSREREKKA